MIRTISKVCRGISSSNIAMTPKQLKDPLTTTYPVLGHFNIKLGAMTLNMPQNSNTLSQSLLDEFVRHILSYKSNMTLNSVFLDTKGKTFSLGADYYQLKHNDQYLDKLFRMLNILAQFNKPIYAYCKGGVHGLGAYLLNMATFIIGTQNCVLKLDETRRGMIPIGGSHRLNKLIPEVGLYLALVGPKLNADQMAQLNFLDSFLSEDLTSKDIRKSLDRQNLKFNQRMMLNQSSKGDYEALQQYNVYTKMHEFQQQNKIARKNIALKKQNYYKKMALNQYQRQLIMYENTKNSWNSFNTPGIKTTNYFERKSEPFEKLLQEGTIKAAKYSGQYNQFPLQDILQVFGQPSFRQMIQKLTQKSSTSQWAKQTLTRLRRNDPLAVRLTYKLLKQTRNQAWIKCLETQYTVAKKIVKSSQLVLQQTQKGSIYLYKNKFSKDLAQNIPEEVINGYFIATSTEQMFQHQIVANGLHPVKDYRHIPDGPRLYMNKQFFHDQHVVNVKYQIQRYLNSFKIDYRSLSFDNNLLRQIVHRNQRILLSLEHEFQRLRHFRNSNSFDRYKQQRANLIQNIDSSFKSNIDSLIQQYFNKSFDQKFKPLQKTAQIAGLQNKLDFFKKLRTILIKSVVFQGKNIQQGRTQNRQAYFQGILRFSKQGKSIFDSQNYSSENDPFYQKLQKDILGEQSENLNLDQPLSNQLGHGPLKKTKLQVKDQKFFINVEKRYAHENIRNWWEAKLYQKWIQEFSITSEEIAGLMGWEIQDIQATLLNAPQAKKTYQNLKQQAQAIKNNRSKSLQKRLQNINKAIENFKQKNQNLSVFKQNANMASNRRTKYQYIVALQKIPQAIRQPFLSLYDEVIVNVAKEAQIDPINFSKKDAFMNYLQRCSSQNQSSEIKHDVQFMYSFVGILYLKEIFQQIQSQGGIHNLFNTVSYLNKKHGFNFQQGTGNQEIIQTFIQYMYFLMDLHYTSKRQLKNVSTKLLDFLNRLEGNLSFGVTGRFPKTFQSLMLLIARDRAKILRRNQAGKLGIQPQHMKYMINNTLTDLNPLALTKPKQRYLNDIKHQMQIDLTLNRPTSPTDMRQLVIGYQYYMRLFDQMLTKASGKYNFLPEEMLKPQSQLKLQKNRKLGNIVQKPQQWLQQKLHQVISDIFQVRKTNEKYMTKGELIFFDYDFIQNFQVENIKAILKDKLQKQQQQIDSLFEDDYDCPQSFDSVDDKYTLTRRNIKNKSALQLLNNLTLSDEVNKSFMKEKVLQGGMSKQQLQYYQDSLKNQDSVTKTTKKRLKRQVFKFPTEQHAKMQNFVFLNKNEQKNVKYSQFQQQYKNLHDIAKEEEFEQMYQSIKIMQKL